MNCINSSLYNTYLIELNKKCSHLPGSADIEITRLEMRGEQVQEHRFTLRLIRLSVNLPKLHNILWNLLEVFQYEYDSTALPFW